MLQYEFVTDKDIIEDIPSLFAVSTLPTEDNKFKHKIVLDINNYNIPIMKWINDNIKNYTFSVTQRENMKSKLLLTLRYRKPYNRTYTSEMYNYLDDYDEIFIMDRWSNGEIHNARFIIMKYNNRVKDLLINLSKWECDVNITKLINKLDNPPKYIDKGILLKLQLEWNLLENIDDKDFVISKYNQIFAKYVDIVNKIII